MTDTDTIDQTIAAAKGETPQPPKTNEQQIGAYVHREGELDMPPGLKDDTRNRYSFLRSTRVTFRARPDEGYTGIFLAR